MVMYIYSIEYIGNKTPNKYPPKRPVQHIIVMITLSLPKSLEEGGGCPLLFCMDSLPPFMAAAWH